MSVVALSPPPIPPSNGKKPSPKPKPSAACSNRHDRAGHPLLFPIIGAPVAGVFSPPAFNAHFAAHGIAARMDPIELAPDGLPAFLDLLRQSPSFAGCSITYPHKQAAFAGVDHHTDRAARLGALNTIRRNPDGTLTGDATDGAAICAAILAKGGTISGKSARILGAGGGAGQAIADALCTLGLSHIALDETDPTRATLVRTLIETHWPDVTLLPTGSDADILINATTLGKSGDDPLPFNEPSIAAAEIVCDVVTHSTATPLVARAAAMHKPTVTGADMGAGQLAPQLAFLGLS
ncbi:hypothetical protein N4R57_03290 [Rhodobacteraceae bacterium D3-12]|nr:hypothetical protein N4R57_03290 [Rhodobacteraceae bacterium D3-12]